MKLSTDRILTTHVGSLPRSEAVTRGVFAIENEEAIDMDAHRAEITKAVDDVVARQVGVGVDVVSDGEMSKLSYATYIKDRITGFEGDSPRRAPADLEDHPSFLERQARSGGTPTYKRPQCVGPIGVKDMGPCQGDIANFAAAIDAHGPHDAFMNAASPVSSRCSSPTPTTATMRRTSMRSLRRCDPNTRQSSRRGTSCNSTRRIWGWVAT